MTALRANVVKALRANVPEPLKAALEQLLADNGAVTAIQNLVSANFKTPAGITAEAILGLPMAEATKGLLTGNRPLVDYLVNTAISKIPH